MLNAEYTFLNAFITIKYQNPWMNSFFFSFILFKIVFKKLKKYFLNISFS